MSGEMTVLDHFAAAAMQGMLMAAKDSVADGRIAKDTAERAFAYAQAMMEVRKTQPKPPTVRAGVL